jgi:hypothetical protein
MQATAHREPWQVAEKGIWLDREAVEVDAMWSDPPSFSGSTRGLPETPPSSARSLPPRSQSWQYQSTAGNPKIGGVQPMVARACLTRLFATCKKPP